MPVQMRERDHGSARHPSSASGASPPTAKCTTSGSPSRPSPPSRATPHRTKVAAAKKAKKQLEQQHYKGAPGPAAAETARGWAVPVIPAKQAAFERLTELEAVYQCHADVNVYGDGKRTSRSAWKLLREATPAPEQRDAKIIEHLGVA